MSVAVPMVCGPRGRRGPNPRHLLDHQWNIAQLVEHPSEKREVPGSTPGVPAMRAVPYQRGAPAPTPRERVDPPADGSPVERVWVDFATARPHPLRGYHERKT